MTQTPTLVTSLPRHHFPLTENVMVAVTADVLQGDLMHTTSLGTCHRDGAPLDEQLTNDDVQQQPHTATESTMQRGIRMPSS